MGGIVSPYFATIQEESVDYSLEFRWFKRWTALEPHLDFLQKLRVQSSKTARFLEESPFRRTDVTTVTTDAFELTKFPWGRFSDIGKC